MVYTPKTSNLIICQIKLKITWNKDKPLTDINICRVIWPIYVRLYVFHIVVAIGVDFSDVLELGLQPYVHP